MKLKIQHLSITILSVSILLITACSSDNDAMDHESLPVTLSSEDSSLDEDLNPNQIEISFLENGKTSYRIPIIMLSDEEFQQEMQNKTFIQTESISKNTNRGVEMTYKNDYYQVTLRNDLLVVKYETKYPYEFPSNPKSFFIYTELDNGEYPGPSYGRVNGNRLNATLDILKKVGDNKFEYAYTLGLSASIVNNQIRVD